MFETISHSASIFYEKALLLRQDSPFDLGLNPFNPLSESVDSPPRQQRGSLLTLTSGGKAHLPGGFATPPQVGNRNGETSFEFGA